MKTTFNTLVLIGALACLVVSLPGCGGLLGSIRTPYGDITSGTVNLDLRPVFDDRNSAPPPKSYTDDLYPLPPLEK